MPLELGFVAGKIQLKDAYLSFFRLEAKTCSLASGSRVSKERPKPLWPINSNAVLDIQGRTSIYIATLEPEGELIGQRNLTSSLP